MAQRKQAKQVVEQLMAELGLPSSGKGKGKKGQFKNLSLLLAVLKTSKNAQEVISSLTLDLSDGDNITQHIDPNGDYVLTLRLKHFK